MYFHVFVLGWIFHGLTEIEIIDVHACCLGIVGRDDVVEEDLGHGDIESASTLVAREIDEIPSYHKTCAIWFFFGGSD